MLADRRTRRPRARGVRAALAAALSVLLAAGGIVAGAALPAAASTGGPAHGITIQTTCTTATVQVRDFSTDPTGEVRNRVEVSVVNDGVASPLATQEFDAQTDVAVELGAQSGVTRSVVATVIPWNATSSYEHVSSSQVVPPCYPPSITDVTATPCVSSASAGTITADLDDLVPDRVYEVTLVHEGGAVVETRTVTGITGQHRIVWTGITQGGIYTVRAGIQGSALVNEASTTQPVVGCGVDAYGFEFAFTQCDVVGGQAGVTVTVTGLVSGREYSIEIAGSSPVDAQPVPADHGGTATATFDLPPASGTWSVSLVDVLSGEVVQGPVTPELMPCPEPYSPKIGLLLDECVPGQTASRLDIEAFDLTEGREYEVLVNGAPVAPSFVADDTRVQQYALDLPPGEYVVVVRDLNADQSSATDTRVVQQCASIPEVVTIEATACAAPGDDTDVSATFEGLTAGRDYRVEILAGGERVAGQPVLGITSATPQPVVFSGLERGIEYELRIADVDDARAADSATVTAEQCEGTPGLSAAVVSCDMIGQTSTLGVGFTGAVPGEVYSAVLERGSSSGPQTVDIVSGITADGEIRFDGVSNGAEYTVRISNATGELTASAVVLVEGCGFELPTLPLPPGGTPSIPAGSLPTLALTGAALTAPGIAAIVLLQLGIAFVGVGIVRRRLREARA